MTATTVAREVRQVPRPRHLRLVPPSGAAPAARPGDRPRPEPAVGPAGPGLRLTRRGRLVLATALWSAIAVGAALAVLAAVLLFGGSAQAGGDAGDPVVSAEHVVRPGETLWGIASAWAPGEDPRDAVAELVEFNALSGVDVVAGQRLLLPELP